MHRRLRVLRCGALLLFLMPAVILASDHLGRIETLSVSPDGKLIAATYETAHTRLIYRIALDTGRATRLTKTESGWESSPTFSPDGKQIAYSYNPGDGAGSQIMIGNPDGFEFHVWSPSAGSSFRPLFSPDGKTMILAHSGFYGSYSPIAQPHPHDWSFFAANLDGTNIRQITDEHFYMASEPSVSPDGATMVLIAEGIQSSRHIAFYSLEHPGKPIRSLQPHVPGEADRRDPIYSSPNYMPDGTSVLFMAASNGRHGFDYDVYRLDLDNGNLERLTQGNGYATELKVFADGKRAAFLKWHTNWRAIPDKSEIFLLNLQTHELTHLAVTGLN